MGYFFARIVVLALLLLVALAAFPVGALLAHRRSLRKYARLPSPRGLSGAAAAGLLLHREGLGRIDVEIGADGDTGRYRPRAGRVELPEAAARATSCAAVAEAAFLVAKVTQHADRDPDFARAQSRESLCVVLANALPAAMLAGLFIPGEARVVFGVLAPVMIVSLITMTTLSFVAEKKAGERALRLLEKHGLVSGESARKALRTVLGTRAASIFATPLTRCLWLSWAL